jgi:uncharacterized protein
VLPFGWTEVVAVAAAYLIATLTAPAGISGAVLLLPFQVSVLGTPSPAVTPTNLLYNVVATPGALYRYWRQGQTGGSLALLLIAGTVPGVIAGSVIRVELLPGPRVFDLVVAAVLIPLGSWLAVTGPASADDSGRPARPIPARLLLVLAAAVGCVGGIYGIGGGSVLAPILIGSGRHPSQVAPAALASTLVTSVAGVITFVLLSIHAPGQVSPDWDTGIALGIGGLAGAYTGARLQSRLPDALIRRMVGILVIVIGARYLWSGLGWPTLLAAEITSRSGHVPPGAGTPRIGSPIGGDFDSRSDAMVGHRLVIEARDNVQVGVKPALIVPAERVAVRSEPLV